jgi:hypothetical protein
VSDSTLPINLRDLVTAGVLTRAQAAAVNAYAGDVEVGRKAEGRERKRRPGRREPGWVQDARHALARKGAADAAMGEQSKHMVHMVGYMAMSLPEAAHDLGWPPNDARVLLVAGARALLGVRGYDHLAREWGG